MNAMVVTKDGMKLEQREVPAPKAGEVRVKVHACGVCHSDHFVVDRLWPGLELPRVPGHEVAGVVDAVGEGVRQFKAGDRVGLGWHGGHDGTCDPCLAGHFVHCQNQRITGITADGGYAEYLTAPAVALARVPQGMSFTTAAPLLCAGVTTYNALRNSGARSGDLVGVQGLGGLGHLGVQFARAMGFEVVAISRGKDKEEFARKLGGARVILATAPDAKSISGLVAGLGIEGCLLLVAAPFEPFAVSAIDLLSGSRRIQGWSSGTAIDSTDTLDFAKLHGVAPMVETFPLREAEKAYQRMMSGKARFRAVLDLSAA